MKMPSRPHKEQLGKVSSKNLDCSQIENEEEEEEEDLTKGKPDGSAMGGR